MLLVMKASIRKRLLSQGLEVVTKARKPTGVFNGGGRPLKKPIEQDRERYSRVFYRLMFRAEYFDYMEGTIGERRENREGMWQRARELANGAKSLRGLREVRKELQGELFEDSPALSVSLSNGQQRKTRVSRNLGFEDVPRFWFSRIKMTEGLAGTEAARAWRHKPFEERKEACEKYYRGTRFNLSRYVVKKFEQFMVTYGYAPAQ